MVVWHPFYPAECVRITAMSGAHAGHTMTGLDAPVTIPPGAIYTEADVRFMQGMIAHHAQAIVMARLAEKNSTNTQLLKLSRKIDQSQVPEIQIMQDWLRRYNQFAPDTSSWHDMQMDGMAEVWRGAGRIGGGHRRR